MKTGLSLVLPPVVPYHDLGTSHRYPGSLGALVSSHAFVRLLVLLVACALRLFPVCSYVCFTATPLGNQVFSSGFIRNFLRNVFIDHNILGWTSKSDNALI